MKNKRHIIIFATITLMATLLIPVFMVGITQAADPSNWFKTVDGVLDTDYYTLYPYETDKSLKIGFSKFGELINSKDNVGLEYGAVDPFGACIWLSCNAASSETYVASRLVPKHHIQPQDTRSTKRLGNCYAQ
jgi:hypothetical protein